MNLLTSADVSHVACACGAIVSALSSAALLASGLWGSYVNALISDGLGKVGFSPRQSLNTFHAPLVIAAVGAFVATGGAGELTVRRLCARP